jgi:hypothetical protein
VLNSVVDEFEKRYGAVAANELDAKLSEVLDKIGAGG